MSQETQAWAKEVRTGDPVSKAVLIEIANWAKPDGSVEFLSLARLADVLEISKRSVQRHLNRLEFELGFIRRNARHRDDGGQGSNCFDLFSYPPPFCVFHPVVCFSPPGVPGAPPPRQNGHPPRDTAVTRLGDKNILPPSEPDGSDAPKGDELPLGDEKAEEAKPAKRERSRGVRIDPEWKAPSIEDLPETIRPFVERWASGEYLRQAVKFLNHWLASSGRNAAKRDWARAWYNWLIEAEERGLTKRSASPGRATNGSTSPTAIARDGETEPSKQIRARVSKRLGKVAYQQWVGPCAIIVTPGNAVEVRCPSEFHAAHLERNYEVDVLRACRESIGERFGGVKFVDWSRR